MSFLGPIVRYVETCRRVISGDPGLSEHFHKGLSRVNELRRKPRAELELSESRQHVLNEVQRLLANEDWSESKRDCPECSRQFIVLTVVDVPVDYCRTCRSFWFDAGELREVTQLLEDIPGADLAHRDSRLDCPICDEAMTEYQFARGDNLLVDQCPQRHGVYLQDQELSRALLSAERDRPSPG